jgi:hypothetical protein
LTYGHLLKPGPGSNEKGQDLIGSGSAPLVLNVKFQIHLSRTSVWEPEVHRILSLNTGLNFFLHQESGTLRDAVEASAGA